MPPLAVSIGVQAIVGISQVLRQDSLGLFKLGESWVYPYQPGASVAFDGTFRMGCLPSAA